MVNHTKKIRYHAVFARFHYQYGNNDAEEMLSTHAVNTIVRRSGRTMWRCWLDLVTIDLDQRISNSEIYRNLNILESD